MNSVVTLSSDEPGAGFVIGLGVTQVIDARAYLLTHGSEAIEGADAVEGLEGGAATVVLAIAFGLSLGVSLVFIVLGWLAKRPHGWAFIAGRALYAGDEALILLLQDMLGFGFHLFALYCIFLGYCALRNLRGMATLVTAQT